MSLLVNQKQSNLAFKYLQHNCINLTFEHLFMVKKINWDLLGVATSLACAIHCAILPLILSSLPLFGINILHNQFFEWVMIVVAFSVGIYSLVHGYIKHHRNGLPVFLFTIGFICLVLKQYYRSVELWFLLPAVSMIIAAHIYNFTLCRKSKCSSPHHQHWFTFFILLAPFDW